jgi:hypothetical protein
MKDSCIARLYRYRHQPPSADSRTKARNALGGGSEEAILAIQPRSSGRGILAFSRKDSTPEGAHLYCSSVKKSSPLVKLLLNNEDSFAIAFSLLLVFIDRAPWLV